MHGSGRIAYAIVVSSGVFLAAGGLVLALDPVGGSVGHLAVGSLLTFAWAGAAVLVARLSTRSVLGPLMGLVALGIAITTTRELLWQYLALRPVAAASATWLMAVLRESAVWVLVALALVLLFFPEGRLPSSRWRVVPYLLVAAAIAHHAWGVVDPAPFRPPLEAFTSPFAPPSSLVTGASAIAFVMLLAGLLACVAAPFVRYRRAEPVRRSQLRWLAVAGLGVPGFLLVGIVEILISGQPRWPSLVVGLAAVAGLPVAIGIAVLRRDLFDVDRALVSGVTYGLSSLVLAAVFVLVALTTGLLLGRDSVVLAASVTAVTAAALRPAATWLRRVVDRRLYPHSDAAQVALADLQRRIHEGDARPEDLQSVLREAIRDPELRVGYRAPGATRYLDVDGQAVAPEGATPVVVAGETIGVVRPGRGGASAQLLRTVAGACGVLVEVVRLRQELSSVLREVEKSRARIMRAADDERQRLERDLHDGSQQRLISLGMALRLAQRQLAAGRVDVFGLLDQTVAEIGTAVAELRQLAHGIRPSSLDDGLQPALASLAQRLPVPLVLDVTQEPLPDHVVTTLYFVASEAITNAVKHGHPSQVEVRIVLRGDRVHLRVADDGCGGAGRYVGGTGRRDGAGRNGDRSGSGLVGLADRVAAAGGELLLHSPAGSGTAVEVELPCVS